jgi:aminomethyltransferase
MSVPAHPAASITSSESLAPELRAILTGAAFAPINMGWLRVTGPDATRWLNGMVTNAVNALAPGEGCYNFLLNAQGRILGDCTIYRDPGPEPPSFLLETDAAQLEAIRTHLDKFIIMDDVELVSAPSNESSFLVLGPNSPALLREHYGRGGNPSTMPPLRLAFNSEAPAQISTPSPSLVPQFEIREGADSLTKLLIDKGAVSASPAALDALRILCGTPRYGVDIRNTDKAHDLPQETAQDRALHFAKGCYLGQEIVERIRSRGSVHRSFTGFVLSGELPASGTELTTESQQRPAGELTSVAAIPRAAFDPSASADAAPVQIALGYIRREALDRNLSLTYPGGTAKASALPFAIPGLSATQS